MLCEIPEDARGIGEVDGLTIAVSTSAELAPMQIIMQQRTMDLQDRCRRGLGASYNAQPCTLTLGESGKKSLIWG
jgi:hypothetical protein